MIHEQVKMQLNYLKSSVDGEVEQEKRCKEWGIPYTPSNRKYEDIRLYNEYKEEIEKNGDKNLLVMVRIDGEDDINMYGVYPFARRYVGEYYLVHRNKNGGEILFTESEVKVIKTK